MDAVKNALEKSVAQMKESLDELKRARVILWKDLASNESRSKNIESQIIEIEDFLLNNK